MSDISIPLPIDYSYLYEISDNDRDFIKDMLDTIVKNTPGNLDEIGAAEQGQKWNELARSVHKLKPSLLLLNIASLTDLVKSLESNAKSQAAPATIKKQIAELKEFCDLLVSEIKKDIASDDY
ncbi:MULTISPECIES: Hpt domain-containing protein [Reichenbachiella]|uniref:HPt (Histidine-containing phosphotransfer) domain-containing protein n=1 Tax=Reichenbachiella agariperforans TaxID=156994 RepID=A0A1M6L739_REIAG|nr:MULTISPECIES: Hpt domain-containing protein [Reichenbachiella]MBU2913810.1 Hpt domain-containing protein [Reichenbachiella agariperforans]RJE74267.1 hypothetical protein BGP76_13880 [Reichenbachiella sp. MSK19-1]SHJ66879.1 HPt (histidine-containing phosphotransfer) domain-containing protein [Reichenbachiella agariperforans]